MAVQIRNTATRWGAVSQLFHWAIVAMILAQFVLANIADSLPSGVGKLATLAQHKSVGITILLLAVLRLLWKVTCKPSPALPADLKRYERFLAHLTHHGLYLLLFLLPLSGWTMSSAKNFPVSWFGLVKLPDVVAPNETLFEALKQTHEVLATALMAVAALHVLGALQHQFIRRDDILRRMLPFTAPGTKLGALKLALTALAAFLLSGLAWRALTAGTTTGAAPSAATRPLDSGPATDAGQPGTAQAAAWSADAATSALGFSFVQAGAATDGRFGRFTAAIDFAAAPQPAGRFDVSIDMTSVDTQDKDRNEQLKSADLYDVVQFPAARYVATSFAATPGGFEARGQLTLRGVTRDVPLTFTWIPDADGKSATLKGSAALKRLEFGVGQGEWKSTEWVGDDVNVTFNLRLVPAAAAR